MRPLRSAQRMKLALYARVSKDAADSRGRYQDPENQLVPLRKMAEALGAEGWSEYVDRVSGGTSNRPAFQKMLSKVRQRHHDLVLVWDLDRFSREGVTATLAYVEQLRQYGAGLRTLRDNIDTSNPGIGDVIVSVLAYAARLERDKISDRTKAGLATARKKGKVLGRPPKCEDCGLQKWGKKKPLCSCKKGRGPEPDDSL